jgi:hypothetical protein
MNHNSSNRVPFIAITVLGGFFLLVSVPNILAYGFGAPIYTAPRIAPEVVRPVMWTQLVLGAAFIIYGSIGIVNPKLSGVGVVFTSFGLIVLISFPFSAWAVVSILNVKDTFILITFFAGGGSCWAVLLGLWYWIAKRYLTNNDAGGE